MAFMTRIIEDLNSATEFFYSVYREVLDWPWPFWYAAHFFYSLSRVFNWLAWDFYDFAEWVNDIASKLTTFLSFLDLEQWFKDWKEKILDTWDWVRYAWNNVTGIIDIWWRDKEQDVKDWIGIATQGFDNLVVAWDTFRNITWPQWTSDLSELRLLWDTFWTVTFPDLVNFSWLTIWWNDRLLDIQGLVDTAFLLRDNYWAGWQDWRDKVTEFFIDPLGWLENKFTDWFLGAE